MSVLCVCEYEAGGSCSLLFWGGFHPELHATMLSFHAGTQAAGKPENRAGRRKRQEFHAASSTDARTPD